MLCLSVIEKQMEAVEEFAWKWVTTHGNYRRYLSFSCDRRLSSKRCHHWHGQLQQETISRCKHYVVFLFKLEMCHNVQWTTGYRVLLEAAQVVYSVNCKRSKRCSYWKEHYSECIRSVKCSEVKLEENIAPTKRAKAILNHKVILIRSFCPEKSTQQTGTS